MIREELEPLSSASEETNKESAQNLDAYGDPLENSITLLEEKIARKKQNFTNQMNQKYDNMLM